MEHSSNELILLRCEVHLELHLTIREEPCQISARIFFLVKSIEALNTQLKLLGQLANLLVHLWPGSICEYFTVKFNALDRAFIPA